MINKMEEVKKFRVVVEYKDGTVGFFDYFDEVYAIESCNQFCPFIHRRICLMVMNDEELYEIKRTVTA